MVEPVSFKRPISPPASISRKKQRLVSSRENEQSTSNRDHDAPTSNNQGPTLAAVEAGEAQIRDHLAYFVRHLKKVSRSGIAGTPRLPIEGFRNLYQQNMHSHGHHFVVHQHDHPISGVHYDLRLQVSESSSISFAIPYGLPGNPNSVRSLRMAIETRVHNVWNHLIESASHATGSLLIWDTGEYEVVLRDRKEIGTDDETSDQSDSGARDDSEQPTETDKLVEAFRAHHVRLRLHGTRLPHGYTISLRLPAVDKLSRQPSCMKRKRRSKRPLSRRKNAELTDDDTETEIDASQPLLRQNAAQATIPTPTDSTSGSEQAMAVASDNDESESIRQSNAYPGATNDIGSIHQRKWVLMLDRRNSGFVKSTSGTEKGRWVKAPLKGDGCSAGWDPFFVEGRDVERSIITGRSAAEVMADEGVEGFIGRKMWRPVLE
ncbi:DNA polymerase ligase-domain-containing protein [Cryomyces antarcticus]